MADQDRNGSETTVDELETQILAKMHRRLIEAVTIQLGIAGLVGVLLAINWVPHVLGQFFLALFGLSFLALAALTWREGRAAQEKARRQFERSRSEGSN